jgi:ribonucleoside-triphosphate reductase (thioredoxin)
MHITQQTLSDIVVYNKYSKHIPSLKRRETWDEIVIRYATMMVEKYPDLANEIWVNARFLQEKKVLMSMRAAQFAGISAERNNSRIYNCAFLPIDNPAAFSEAMFLLLGGTGVGFSVQSFHVAMLPNINKSTKEHKFLIGDSIEGWADAIKAIMYWAFGRRKTKPVFDFSDIRKKGEKLVTSGGKAPGPDPLKECLFKIEQIINSKQNGSKLSPIEVHDIVCYIAHSVLAGGIRRAALISLFSPDDQEMLNAKAGNWWELNPQRGRANNSVVFDRQKVTVDQFSQVWKAVRDSNAGEPGIYFTNNILWGTNPCCEIALKPFQFCNLTEINAGLTTTQEELNEAARVAAFFGTLQAGITDFHYLRPIWKQTTEEDALIGVGITGIANGNILPLDLKEAANIAKQENKRIAHLIGINSAARVTTIKPSGTTSCVVGTSSGIHAWHSKYYIRNMQCKVGDDLYNFFSKHHPNLIKIMDYDPKSAVIGIPQMAPDTAIFRDEESAMELLERVKRFNIEWVREGHRSGDNTNNVSATISLKDHEWDEVRDWMWKNRNIYNGLSVLPFDGGSYADAPFQTINEQQYLEKLQYLSSIDLTQIAEEDDNTDLTGEVACAGGACEIQY